MLLGTLSSLFFPQEHVVANNETVFFYRTSFLKRRKSNDVPNDENTRTETSMTRTAKEAEAWEGAEGHPVQTTVGAGSTNPWPSRILLTIRSLSRSECPGRQKSERFMIVCVSCVSVYL
jgi:hypothetical protein